MYEDNLQGVVEPLPWEVDNAPDYELRAADLPWRTYRPPPFPDRTEWLRLNARLIDQAMTMLSDWMASGIEVVPFRKRSDVTIRMFQALDDSQAGVFLRLYVPHGRYQSEQLEDFLTLFSRYLRDVEGKEFSIDAQRTSRGTTYVFKGRGDASTVNDLREATARFDGFLTLAEMDARAAEQLLVTGGALPADAGFIVAKYARSMRRLQLESRHEFERRSLQLRQELEAELLDANAASPVLPSPERPSALLSIVGSSAPVIVNVAPGAMAQNSSVVVENVLSGGIEYTPEDRAVLEFIDGVKDEIAALELRSALDRLKDPATPPEERRTGIQKLKSFVYRAGAAAGKKLDEVGTNVLIAYLSSLVKPPDP